MPVQGRVIGRLRVQRKSRNHDAEGVVGHQSCRVALLAVRITRTPILGKISTVIRTRTGVLIAAVALRTVTIMLCGLAPSFGIAVTLYLVSNFASGEIVGRLNRRIKGRRHSQLGTMAGS